MTKRIVDWEAIEREYRAGVLSVSEIARQHGIAHPTIFQRATKHGWERNLAKKIKERAKAKLATVQTTEGATATTTVSRKSVAEKEEEAVESGAALVVEVVRDHIKTIGTANTVVGTLLAQMIEAVGNRALLEEMIESETEDDTNVKRRQMLMRAVSLPSHASAMLALSGAMKNLIGLERQAFNLDGEDDERSKHGSGVAVAMRMSLDELLVIAATGQKALTSG